MRFTIQILEKHIITFVVGNTSHLLYTVLEAFWGVLEKVLSFHIIIVLYYNFGRVNLQYFCLIIQWCNNIKAFTEMFGIEFFKKFTQFYFRLHENLGLKQTNSHKHIWLSKPPDLTVIWWANTEMMLHGKITTFEYYFFHCPFMSFKSQIFILVHSNILKQKF